MKKLAIALIVTVLFSSFAGTKPLTGTWEFKGGIYNGKKEGATVGYVLQKKYTAGAFECFMVEKGSKPQKYQAGIYKIDDKIYTETETFSSQESQVTGKPIKYQYTISHDTLTIRGTLPTGMKVEEYWKKVK